MGAISVHSSQGFTASGPISDEVYDTLRTVARRYLAAERSGHTLQATALVHEAYLRLASRPSLAAISHDDMLAAASKTMRLVLVDYARRRRAAKRDRKLMPVDDTCVSQQPAVDFLELHEAMNRLEAVDPELSRVVELLYFGGLTQEEAARVLKCSARSVQRAWQVARMWMAKELTSCTRE